MLGRSLEICTHLFFFPSGCAGSSLGLLRWLSGEESTSQCRRCRWMSGLGRCPGGGHGNPLQYSCLGDPRGSLVGYRPWGRKESDSTEWLSTLGSSLWPTGLAAPRTARGVLVSRPGIDHQVHVPCIGRQVLNPWTTRNSFFFFFFKN